MNLYKPKHFVKRTHALFKKIPPQSLESIRVLCKDFPVMWLPRPVPLLQHEQCRISIFEIHVWSETMFWQSCNNSQQTSHPSPGIENMLQEKVWKANPSGSYSGDSITVLRELKSTQRPWIGAGWNFWRRHILWWDIKLNHFLVGLQNICMANFSGIRPHVFRMFRSHRERDT